MILLVCMVVMAESRIPHPGHSHPGWYRQGLCILTDGLQEPLGLVLPPDAEEVDRQPAEDNGKANATLLGCLPEGHSNEEKAGQDEKHREGQVHLG